MAWTNAGVLAVFDGERGAGFLVMLIALMAGGLILLIINLSARPRAPPPPAWEPVADDAPTTPAPAAEPAPARPAPRRRA